MYFRKSFINILRFWIFRFQSFSIVSVNVRFSSYKLLNLDFWFINGKIFNFYSIFRWIFFSIFFSFFLVFQVFFSVFHRLKFRIKKLKNFSISFCIKTCFACQLWNLIHAIVFLLVCTGGFAGVVPQGRPSGLSQTAALPLARRICHPEVCGEISVGKRERKR